MKNIALGILRVLAIVFIVPFVMYAAFSAVTGLQPPGDAPWMFLFGVFVFKSARPLGSSSCFGLPAIPMMGIGFAMPRFGG